MSEEWVASDLSDSTHIPPLVCVSLSFCLTTQPPIFLVSLASSFGPASTPQFSSIYKDDKENLRMKKKVGWGGGEEEVEKEGRLREGKNLAVAEDDS